MHVLALHVDAISVHPYCFTNSERGCQRYKTRLTPAHVLLSPAVPKRKCEQTKKGWAKKKRKQFLSVVEDEVFAVPEELLTNGSRLVPELVAPVTSDENGTAQMVLRDDQH